MTKGVAPLKNTLRSLNLLILVLGSLAQAEDKSEKQTYTVEVQFFNALSACQLNGAEMKKSFGWKSDYTPIYGPDYYITCDWMDGRDSYSLEKDIITLPKVVSEKEAAAKLKFGVKKFFTDKCKCTVKDSKGNYLTYPIVGETLEVQKATLKKGQKNTLYHFTRTFNPVTNVHNTMHSDELDKIEDGQKVNNGRQDESKNKQ